MVIVRTIHLIVKIPKLRDIAFCTFPIAFFLCDNYVATHRNMLELCGVQHSSLQLEFKGMSVKTYVTSWSILLAISMWLMIPSLMHYNDYYYYYNHDNVGTFSV